MPHHRFDTPTSRIDLYTLERNIAPMARGETLIDIWPVDAREKR